MSIELIAISGFIVAILGGLSQCISKSNLKHCNCGCINSDCVDENKSLDKQMQELNEKIERNEKKINKNKGKLDVLKKKDVVIYQKHLKVLILLHLLNQLKQNYNIVIYYK